MKRIVALVNLKELTAVGVGNVFLALGASFPEGAISPAAVSTITMIDGTTYSVLPEDWVVLESEDYS